jgi:TolB-like protein
LLGSLLWASQAAAADLQGGATALAEEAFAGFTGGGGAAPTRLSVVPFGGGEVAQLFTQRLTGALHDDYGIEPVPLSGLSGALAQVDGALAVPPAWLDAAAKAGAQAILTGAVSCTAQVCTVNAIGYDVTSRQPTSVTTLEMEAPSADTLAAGLQEGQDTSSLRHLVDRLAGGLRRIEGDLRYQRFAVAPLAEQGQSAQEGHLGTLLASELTRRLRREYQLTLVDLDKVQEALSGMRLDAADLDRTRTLTLNAQLGTQGMVVGSVAKSEGQFLVNAQVIAGRDGEVVMGEEAVLPPAEVWALAAKAGQAPDPHGAFKRSFVPGWGQFYAGHVPEGVIFSVGEAALLAAAFYFGNQYNEAWDAYLKLPNGTSQRKLNEQFDVALSDYHTRNWMFGVAAGLYVVNIIHAALIHPDFD